MPDHIERVRDALEAAGIEVNEVRPLPTGLGQQLRCAGGAVVVVYNSGKVVAQGKGAEAAKVAVEGLGGPVKVPAPKLAAKKQAPTLPLALDRPAAGPGDKAPTLWTSQPWDGVSLPWDPVG